VTFWQLESVCSSEPQLMERLGARAGANCPQWTRSTHGVPSFEDANAAGLANVG
jgi:hypothetical protein